MMFDSLKQRKLKSSSIPRPKVSHNIPSPVPHLLHSNEPPSEKDRMRIRVALIAVERELESASLEDVGKANAMLWRAKLQFVKQHRAILSSFRLLPTPVLEKIFLYCVEEENPKWINPPWRVGFVCRRWGNLARSMPILSSTVPPIVLDRKAKRQNYLLYLENIIERSRSATLSLHIIVPDSECGTHPAFDLLVSHANRWRSLKMDLESPNFKSLSEKMRGRLSRLERVTINILAPNVVEELDAFRIAPRLRSATIESLCGQATVNLPWSQLTLYTERSFDNIGISTVMSNSPHLTSLVYIASNLYRFTTPIRPTTLHHLTCIQLFISHHTSPSVEILTKSTLPSLTDMKIQSPSYSPVSEIMTLISRSACRLTNLVLLCDTMEPGTLTQLLRLTPDLTHLGISNIPTLDLVSLSITTIIDPLVPSLEHLVMFSPTCQQEINDMLSARCDLESPNNSPEPVNPSIRTLKTGRLLFPSMEERDEAQGLLEWWSVSPGPAADKVREWREDLDQEWREYSDNPTSTSESRAGRCMNVNFSTVECYTFPDIHTLYYSGFHNFMMRISRTPPHDLPRNEKYKFYERATALIKSWTPLLIADAVYRRWKNQGKTSLIFVPDGGCRTPKDEMDIIFGEEKEYNAGQNWWDVEVCSAPTISGEYFVYYT